MRKFNVNDQFTTLVNQTMSIGMSAAKADVQAIVTKDATKVVIPEGTTMTLISRDNVIGKNGRSRPRYFLKADSGIVYAEYDLSKKYEMIVV